MKCDKFATCRMFLSPLKKLRGLRCATSLCWNVGYRFGTSVERRRRCGRLAVERQRRHSGRRWTGTCRTPGSALWSNGATSKTCNAALDNTGLSFGRNPPGTVNLASRSPAHNLTFNTSGYTVSGSTLTLGGVSPTIAVLSGREPDHQFGHCRLGLPYLKSGPGTLTLGAAPTPTRGPTNSMRAHAAGRGEYHLPRQTARSTIASAAPTLALNNFEMETIGSLAGPAR